MRGCLHRLLLRLLGRRRLFLAAGEQDQSGGSVSDEVKEGFVGFDRSRDKGTPSTCGEIWAIFVDPAHWDKGVGVALWDAANDGLKEEGCTKVTIWVPVRNERALRFHEHAGFKREMTSLKTVVIGSVKLEEIRLKRDVG